MQFPAEEDMDKRSWQERGLDHSLPRELTADDTWLICGHCKYAENDGDIIDIGKNLMNICLDCPVFKLRESLEESAAEAACS